MTVHVKWYSGARNGRITDMTNAGKRGKTCRTITVLGAPWDKADDPAVKFTFEIERTFKKYANPDIERGGGLGEADFETVRADVLAVIARAREAGVKEYGLRAFEETVRGIDAPRPVLTAGVDGKWSCTADADGIHLAELNDVNEWREITFNQTGARAYAIASKVWHAVLAASTRHEVSQILRGAGAKLHGYCGMD